MWVTLLAGLAVVAVAGLSATLLPKADAPGNFAQVFPFFMEASVEVTNSARSVGTNIAGAPITPSSDLSDQKTHSKIRWWVADSARYRVEFNVLEGEQERGFVAVSDGTGLINYNRGDNSYARGELPRLPEGARLWPIPMSIPLGPSSFASVDELMGQYRTLGMSVHEAGHESLLGMRTIIFEMSPASTSGTTSWNADGTTVETTRRTGTIRIWVEPTRVVVMKYVVDDEAVKATAAVTRIQFGKPIDPKLFKFEIPDGARQTN
jgi:hypothetical protein